MLFPWDSVPADIGPNGSFTRAKCPKAVSYIDWESWAFGPADPTLEFIAVARTQSDVAALATYLPTDKAKKIAFLNVGCCWALCTLKHTKSKLHLTLSAEVCSFDCRSQTCLARHNWLWRPLYKFGARVLSHIGPTTSYNCCRLQ